MMAPVYKGGLGPVDADDGGAGARCDPGPTEPYNPPVAVARGTRGETCARRGFEHHRVDPLPVAGDA